MMEKKQDKIFFDLEKDVSWACERVESFLEGLAFGLGKSQEHEFVKYVAWIKNVNMAVDMELVNQAELKKAKIVETTDLEAKHG